MDTDTRQRRLGPVHLRTPHPTLERWRPSTITDVAKAAPETFVAEVLPFLSEVLEATGERQEPGGFRVGPRWSRFRDGSPSEVGDALFVGVQRALCAMAPRMWKDGDQLPGTLASSELEALRFLACRVYTAIGEPAADEAIDWLLRDSRNLCLGWGGSPLWATRQLIEVASTHCDGQHLDTLCRRLLEHFPQWELGVEARRVRGLTQYHLLTAIPRTRLTSTVVRRVDELHRRFPDYPPTPPRGATLAHWVGPPVAERAAEFMTEQNWLCAITKYRGDTTDYSRDVPVGGARELARLLGRRAEVEPERFVELAMTFTADTPPAHIVNIVQAVAGRVPVPTLSRLCLHARRIADEAAGLAICRAVRVVAKHADDDPSCSRGPVGIHVGLGRCDISAAKVRLGHAGTTDYPATSQQLVLSPPWTSRSRCRALASEHD